MFSVSRSASSLCSLALAPILHQLFVIRLSQWKYLLNLCWANLFWILRLSAGSVISDHSVDRISDAEVLEAQSPPTGD